jgi:hypothetical protein
MNGYEEQLHARAEMLEETSELADAVNVILAFASGAGVDPRAVVSLRAAVTALSPAGCPPGYQAGSRAARHPGDGYGSDSEFLEAVSDAEDQVRDWLRDAGQLTEHVAAALDKAHADLDHITGATRRLGLCEDTAGILDPLTRRLQAALQALRQVPHELGEVYELVYEFIRRGGKMPRHGRWIEGAAP